MMFLVLDAGAAEEVVVALRLLQGSYRRNPGLTMWTQSVALPGTAQGQ
jgi:hypothetical protein